MVQLYSPAPWAIGMCWPFVTYFRLAFSCLFPILFIEFTSRWYPCYCWPRLPLDLGWGCPWMQISSFTNPRDVTLNTFSLEYFLSAIHTLLAGCLCSFLSHLFHPAFSPFYFISMIHLQLCSYVTLIKLHYAVMQCRAELLPLVLFILVLILTFLTLLQLGKPFFFSFQVASCSSSLPTGRGVSSGPCRSLVGARASGHPLSAEDAEYLPPLPPENELGWHGHSQCWNTTWHNNYFS